MRYFILKFILYIFFFFLTTPAMCLQHFSSSLTKAMERIPMKQMKKETKGIIIIIVKKKKNINCLERTTITRQICMESPENRDQTVAPRVIETPLMSLPSACNEKKNFLLSFFLLLELFFFYPPIFIILVNSFQPQDTLMK